MIDEGVNQSFFGALPLSYGAMKQFKDAPVGIEPTTTACNMYSSSAVEHCLQSKIVKVGR